MTNRNWRLPAGVDELLPPDAWALEITRRRVLDVFRAWGYEYIDPPVVEYLDALLVGAGSDMDLQTLKTVDQQSGRLLGVRADMTAQAVRVDAHSRPESGVQRLCYAGNVVFANPASSLDRRVPLKAGAELFGAPTLAADAEVVALMLEVLDAAGLAEPILVLGHMGIYQSLTKDLDLSEQRSAELFEAMQNKAEADIARLLDGHPRAAVLTALPGLMGEQGVLAEARACFTSAALPAPISASVLEALDGLEQLAGLVGHRAPGVALRFDIAELTGYGYHNGPVFSAYHADRGSAVARGGRYDGIGAAFGRARPATGFDVILNELVTGTAPGGAVWVPYLAAPSDARAAAIRALRSAGEAVLLALGENDVRPERCDRELKERDGSWVLDPVT